MEPIKKALKWFAITVAVIAFIAWASSTADEPLTRGSLTGLAVGLMYGLWTIGKALDRIENKITQLQNAIHRQAYLD